MEADNDDADIEKEFDKANGDSSDNEETDDKDAKEEETEEKELDSKKSKKLDKEEISDKDIEEDLDATELNPEEEPEEPIEDMEAEEPEKPKKPTKGDIIKLLVKAVCDELTASHQYMIAAHIARGPGYCDAVPEYLKHEQEERLHCNQILKRLEQMNNKFKMDLAEIQEGGNKWEPIKTTKVPEQLLILIKAEKDAQRFYKKIINTARDAEDWITNRLFKQLLADEAEHECDLKRISEQFEEEKEEPVDDTALEEDLDNAAPEEEPVKLEKAAKESLFTTLNFF